LISVICVAVYCCFVSVRQHHASVLPCPVFVKRWSLPGLCCRCFFDIACDFSFLCLCYLPTKIISLLSLSEFVMQATNPWHVGTSGRLLRIQNPTEIPLLYHTNKMLVRLFSFFIMAQHPLVDQGILIIEDSRSHSFRHTSLGRTPLDE
jgi:hypothetical protein